MLSTVTDAADEDLPGQILLQLPARLRPALRPPQPT
ncbi:hypothetical protein BJY27_008342 [Streptomyces rapamycinicus]|uniref:Uncharacterized protein n=1 Tax=Streptomyces rapamycinicus TaxID=1226757 RepID=A0ABR6LY67_9ACTN|nr:hypothetical protein [Streptomyces rapamycinicus]